jgi:hypothetical protein
VRVLEGLAQDDPDPGHVAIRHGAGAQELGERPPSHELGDEVDLVLVRRELVDGHYPGVIQTGRCAGLSLHPLAAPTLARHRLDGHLTLELLVPGQPDDPESARSEPPLEAVPPQH